MPPEDFNEKIELLVNDENRIVSYFDNIYFKHFNNYAFLFN